MGTFTITLNKFTHMYGGKHDNNSTFGLVYVDLHLLETGKNIYLDCLFFLYQTLFFNFK